MLASTQMALGEFTKQIAQQAILSATTKDPPAPPQPPQPENVAATILGQIHGMQKALKDDEELLVLFDNGSERVRVMEIFVPSRQVLVLTGTDGNRHLTRVICSVERLQLVCKTIKVQAGAKPARVSLVTPKQKDSNG